MNLMVVRIIIIIIVLSVYSSLNCKECDAKLK